MKVRWSTRCAGGCGWLMAGTLAWRHHQTLWCGGCSAAHVRACEACQPVPVPPKAPEALEPALW